MGVANGDGRNLSFRNTLELDVDLLRWCHRLSRKCCVGVIGRLGHYGAFDDLVERHLRFQRAQRQMRLLDLAGAKPVRHEIRSVPQQQQAILMRR